MMHLQNDSGIIRNLKVVSTKQNILCSPGMRESASISAVIFAIAGMSGAAVQTSANADGGADDVDMYTFELDGIQYAGVTRKATFKNGDEIDVVYEVREQGHEVFGIRRPSTRSIWLYPYMSCGSTAALRRGCEQWLKWSSAFAVFAILFASAVNLLAYKEFVARDAIILLFSMSFATVFLIIVLLSPRLLRFSRVANEIFASMGYDKPKMVDLHKTSKVYRKKNNISWTANNNTELWY